MESTDKFREAAYEIDPIYLQRWSPRSFLEKDVPMDVLHSLFEAARWAPSAGNIQPWRFVFATSEEDRNKFLSFIHESNVVWCKKAPVLIAVISKIEGNRPGSINRTHAFDTGTAWGFLALEAYRKGLVTHGMGGFDREKAKTILNIPDNYEIHAIVAVGYQGEVEALPESYQEREKPSGRKPIAEFITEGSFIKED